MSTKKKNRVKKNKGRGGQRLTNPLEGVAVRIPRAVPFPDAQVVWLHMTQPVYRQTNAAATFTSYELRMNSVFDIDPAIGGPQFNSFPQYAQIYRLYRVLKFRYHVTFVNADATEGMAVCAASPTTVGNNNASIGDYSETRFGKSASFGSVSGGASKVVIKGMINLPTFFGGVNYLTNDALGSLVTGNPATLLYFEYGQVTSTAMTLGCSVTVKVSMMVHFYSPFLNII